MRRHRGNEYPDYLEVLVSPEDLFITVPEIGEELARRFSILRIYNPLLCCGAGGVPWIEKELLKIFPLYQEIRKEEKRFDIKGGWAFLNIESNPFWLLNQLGKDRFVPTTQQSK